MWLYFTLKGSDTMTCRKCPSNSREQGTESSCQVLGATVCWIGGSVHLVISDRPVNWEEKEGRNMTKLVEAPGESRIHLKSQGCVWLLAWSHAKQISRQCGRPWPRRWGDNSSVWSRGMWNYTQPYWEEDEQGKTNHPSCFTWGRAEARRRYNAVLHM